MNRNWEKEYEWLLDMLNDKFGKENVLTAEEDYGEMYAVGAVKNGKERMFRVEKSEEEGGFSLNKYGNKMELALEAIQKLEKYFET